MCNLFLLFYFINSIVFRFDNEDRDVTALTEAKMEEGSGEISRYDVTMTAQIAVAEMKDESPVSCHMRIPNSDYSKEKTITYDGMN